MKGLVRRILSNFSALLIIYCLLISQTAYATVQAISNQNQERFNVMLVIDGSGSLVYGGEATDAGGLRYEAIDLFLALLTNGGNQVGAIIFDDDAQNYLLNTGLQPISGKADKLALSARIRGAGTRNNTDIGSALLTAVETLNAQSAHNGMESVIILFSDGRTDLGDDKEAYSASLEHKETAINTAQMTGIPVYSICLNATSVADPTELKEISDRTSGDFVSVSSPVNLTGAFESFYNLIFSTSNSEQVTSNFAADGTLSFDIDVPTYGAEEVNIILDTSEVARLQLASPTGLLSAAELEDYTMSGGSYDVIKLVDPTVGRWNLTLTGVPQDKVTINVIYNTDSTAVLSTPDGGTDYGAGGTVILQAALHQGGVPITDSSVTREYTVSLTLTDMVGAAVETVDMVPGPNGNFTYNFQETEFTSYEVQATFHCSNLNILSNTLQLNFGNTAPVIAEDRALLEESVVVTPITGHQRSFDLSNYFSDAQDGELAYSISSSQLVDGTASLDGSVLTVHTAKSRSGDLVLRATDSQGAYSEMTIRFKVTNLTPAIFGLIVAGILVGLAVAGFFLYRATHRPFRGTLTVSNSDPAMRSITARSHASFRGKVRLSYFAVGNCGMDARKCCFAALPGRRLEFRSPKPVYYNGVAQKRLVILPGTTELYADENRTRGICINMKMGF